MPLLLIFAAGAVIGGGTTLFVTDKLGTVVKWTVVGVGGYLVYKAVTKG